MDILVTNDDGINAPGIWTAGHALAALGPVLMVAPDANYSGYGAALPPSRQLSYTFHRREQAAEHSIVAFALSGTPAACVQVGLSGVFSKRPIGLVVSGINDARNVGRDIFYSGTVGAALTAHLLGLPALAVSLDTCPAGVAHWETAEWAIRETVRTHWGRWSDSTILLNINVPNLPIAELHGVMVTSLSRASCLSRYQITASSEHTLAVTPRESVDDSSLETGSDAWALAQGYVSVTPVHLLPEVLYLGPGNELETAIPLAPLPQDMAFEC